MSAQPVDVLSVMQDAIDGVGGQWGLERANPIHDARAAVAELIEAADLVASLCSLEWEEADGSRRGATDNSGKRLWFIGDELIRALKSALARVGGAA